MPKNIVFCADGTWNNPYEDEDKDGTPDPTNVVKLFARLSGDVAPESIRCADEQEKTYISGGEVRQIAKYLHGVGDSRNKLVNFLGGAFGAGVIARVVRGYTFISRNYKPGDHIYVVGFSRGAYTARALAGLIASQGVLAPHITQDKELAYKRGSEAWYRARQATKSPSILGHLAEVTANLPAFLSRNSLKDSDLVPVPEIACVAVWDTVGSMGVPEHKKGEPYDAFKFADTKLSSKVQRGIHALALDEERETFVPTFWDDDPRVTQVIFPGAHSDVGGGYPSGEQSRLSDIALAWMIEQLRAAGLLIADDATKTLKPDPTGPAHQPWTSHPWDLPVFKHLRRKFPKGLAVHDSVKARMAAVGVYKPSNLP